MPNRAGVGDALAEATSATGTGNPSSTLAADGSPPSLRAGAGAVDRTAAFARGAPRIPRRAVYGFLAVVVVLGAGGIALEHAFSGAGLSPVSAGAGSSHTTTHGPVVAPPISEPAGPQMSAPLSSFMGISVPPPTSASGLTLVDQSGHVVSLGTLRGTVVVLTFFGAPCTDICPVLAAEIASADAALGSAAARVTFLTVNTDPLHIARLPTSGAVNETGLRAQANWHFLTGSVQALNAVWRHYGVAITASRATGAVAHNDVMYFIDPSGDIRYRATPFADQSATGDFRLPPASLERWGTGIAAYARRLLPGSP